MGGREERAVGSMNAWWDRLTRKRPRFVTDRVILLVSAVVVFLISASFDVTNATIAWLYRHPTWQVDELFTVSVYLVFAIWIYVWRRHKEFLEEVERRRRAEAERELLIAQLQSIVDDFPARTTLLPICDSCKRVRDKKGAWNSVEVYFASRLRIRLDHGICPDCSRRRIGEELHSGGDWIGG
jgi:hypothetical protein